jgi:hypothetical protein
MEYLSQVCKYDYILASFTAPSVKASELSAEITKYNQAFSKLCKRDELAKINKGCVRKLEVTYDREPVITRDMWHGNAEKHVYSRKEYYQRRGLKIGDKNPNYDTYHPHFHCVFAVNKSYFSDRSYLSQNKWLGLWRSVMRDESITQVDVRRVKNQGDKSNAVKEVSKYASKDSDYTISQEVFDVFYGALKGRQVLTFNGAFKEAVAMYKAGGLDEYKTLDNTEYKYMLLIQWNNKEYIERKLRDLSKEELQALSNQAITDSGLNFD